MSSASGGAKRIRAFRDVRVWPKAFELCLEVDRVTDASPRHERYGLAADLRKTARSSPFDTAAGHRRASTLESLRFLDMAGASGAELETQFLLGRARGDTDERLSMSAASGSACVERTLVALLPKRREKASSATVGGSRPSPSAPRVLRLLTPPPNVFKLAPVDEAAALEPIGSLALL